MPDDPIPDPDHVREFRQYRRHLPHWQRPGAMHYLTFSLERPSPVDLSRPRVAPLVIQALQHWHEDRYKLHDFVVMPDHVHMLLEPLEYERGFVSLQRITHSIKTWTAAQINRELHRAGTLWEEETFDHVVRGPGDLRKIRDYIWLNPVRAELVERPTEWPWWGKGMFVRASTSTND